MKISKERLKQLYRDKSNIIIHICPECNGALKLVTVEGDTKFYLCRECLSTWTANVKNNTETELQRYFFG